MNRGDLIMTRKSVILLVAVLMCLLLPLASLAEVDMEGDPLPTLDKPVSITVRLNETDNDLLIRYTQPDSIAKLCNDGEDDWEAPLIELDIKINDGDWTFNRTPGFRTETLEAVYEELLTDLWPGLASSFVLYPGHTHQGELNAFDSWLFPEWLGLESWDLKNNTYSFRFRYVYEYDFYNETTEEYGWKEIVSPWSDIASIGKNASGKVPEKLSAPANLAGKILTTSDDKVPYFHFTYTIPEDVQEANKHVEIVSYMDWKVGSGKWATEGGELIYQGGNVVSGVMDIDPIDKGGIGEIDIEKNTYAFRMCFEFKRPDGSNYRSPFSNVVIMGVDAFSKTSSWAEDIMKKAFGYGLIPDSLIGKDLTQGITRAEFAAISVKVYEALSSKSAAPVAANPFTDTSDPEVLKAYNVGITDGVCKDKFDQNTLYNREQAATMLTRVYKKVSMEGWTLATDNKYTLSYTKPALFSDDSKISTWAKDSVYFMAANGIITGTGNNMFTPRATTPAEEAMNYATAAREQALTMAVRMVENLK